MTAISAQGQQAVKSGKAAERTIESILRQSGCWVQRQRPIGRGMYGTLIRVDFHVTGTTRFPNGLIVESKWQEIGGSVDEKFPYLVDNIYQLYPCPTIIVYGGKGAKRGAIDWLRRQADGTHLVAVLSLEEFLTWTLRNL